MSGHAAVLQEPVALPAERGARLTNFALGCAAFGGVVTLAGFVAKFEQALFSYLVAYVFVVSIALGCLFWVMLHHLTDAGWSVVVRRLAENYALFLLYSGFLFLPVLAGLGYVYHWTHAPESPAALAMWEKKTPWLNVPFFVARSVLYFAVWAWLAWRFTSLSRRQDETKDPALTRKLQRLSPPGMILLGFTSAFAGIDWIMTLQWEWFTTMFGVYFAAGAMISAMATITLTVVLLRGAGLLEKTITEEHLHDLGKLTFAFVIFWAYITFSQYFLTWYAAIPEFTSWFSNRRWVGHGSDVHLGSWHWVGVGIVLLHVIIPFLVLLPRSSKRSPAVLGTVAAGLLVVHFVEVHWQIMPVLHPEGIAPNWIDPGPLLLLLGLMGFVAARAARANPLVPVGDPRLAESLRFENM